MIDIHALGGIVLGALGVVVLVVCSIFWTKRVPSLGDGVVFFLASAGISAGVKVCILSVDPTVLKGADSERLYVFLGGLAVIWVSVETLWLRLQILFQAKSRALQGTDNNQQGPDVNQ